VSLSRWICHTPSPLHAWSSTIDKTFLWTEDVTCLPTQRMLKSNPLFTHLLTNWSGRLSKPTCPESRSSLLSLPYYKTKKTGLIYLHHFNGSTIAYDSLVIACNCHLFQPKLTVTVVPTRTRGQTHQHPQDITVGWWTAHGVQKAYTSTNYY
jgi:hypothetical protein